YCLMDNHYHLLIETLAPNLSKGMKYLNGTYTQAFNRCHNRVGHIYQGRYKAILVEKESYLLELSRYIVLNPVKAGMVRSAKDWKWSSYRSTAGLCEREPCLNTDGLLSLFSKRQKQAQNSYREFVSQGKNQPKIWQSLKNQIYLGSEQFIKDMQARLDPNQSLADIPWQQKAKLAKPLEDYQKQSDTAREAMVKAYLSGHYTLAEVGRHFGVSYATVSRAVKRYEYGEQGI
ncbi:MAG: helix-turn-helix domain-containing protein, partial [Aestuariibacter sp.]|nr:helix-turn-helix domain-containing protein [Aestuariibacter sp.]